MSSINIFNKFLLHYNNNKKSFKKLIWIGPYTLCFLLVQLAASPHADTAVHSASYYCINPNSLAVAGNRDDYLGGVNMEIDNETHPAR